MFQGRPRRPGEEPTLTSQSTTTTGGSALFYGWVVLVACCVLMFTLSVVRSAIGVWVVPMEQTFQVDRATISWTGTIFSLLFGVAQPFIGRIADRLGPRWAISGGLLLVGVGLLATMTAGEVWQVWLWYSGVAALGFAASGFVTQSALLSRWFLRYRARAVGAMTAGFSLGFTILIQVVTQLTAAYGWQTAAGVMGAFFLLVSTPVALLVLRNNPEEIGQRPDGAAVIAGAPPVKPVFTGLRQAARTLNFWLLVGGYTTCGFVITMIQFHLIPLARGLGYSASEAAWSIAFIGLANTVAAVPAGWLADRFGKRWVLAGAYGLRVVGLLYLTTVTDLVGVYVFSVLFGLTWLNTIPSTSGLTADLFGRFSVGLLFGFIAMCHELGGAVATQLAGWIFVATGSYTGALVVGALLSLGAAIASACIRPPRAAPASEARVAGAVGAQPSQVA